MKKAKAVTIIGGADGPTSVFLVGQVKGKKKPLKQRIRQCIHQYRRKKASKKICANPHTLQEVLKYADQKYHVSEVPKTQRNYTEQFASLKEGLILKHKPELLGDLAQITRPEVFDEDSAKEMFRQMQLRSERAASIPDHEMPTDFHIYEIQIENCQMEISIDFLWDHFGVSYSGDKSTFKKMKKISRELYLYYGVSKEDIKNKTERYTSLLHMLST